MPWATADSLPGTGNWQRLLRRAGEKELPLPPPGGALEEDYQALLRAVYQYRARLSAENENRFRELTDYYSLWAHQIKPPHRRYGPAFAGGRFCIRQGD